MALNQPGIYKIKCLANGKYYIGQSSALHRRWLEHVSKLRSNKHCNPILQAAWNKYGKDQFVFEVIFECPERLLDQLEQHLIDAYKADPGLMNCSLEVQTVMRGRKHTPETIKRLSELKQGENHWGWGKPNCNRGKRQERLCACGSPVAEYWNQGRFKYYKKTCGVCNGN